MSHVSESALVALSLATGCAATPHAGPAAPASVPELIAAEEALFAAIQRRDREALAALVTDDFVHQAPGQAAIGRDAFLATLAEIPGELLSVAGEGVTARAIGPDAGLVAGVQVSRLRIDGAEVVARGAFADVFERRAGRWLLTYAFVVELPVAEPQATPPPATP